MNKTHAAIAAFTVSGLLLAASTITSVAVLPATLLCVVTGLTLLAVVYHTDFYKVESTAAADIKLMKDNLELVAKTLADHDRAITDLKFAKGLNE